MRFLILVVMIALLAGCFQENPNTNDSENEDEVGPGLVNDLPSNQVRLEGCYLAFGISSVLAPFVEDYIPDGFRMRNYAPGQTLARTDIYDCERAVFNDTVEEDVQIFKARIEVEVLMEDSEKRYSHLIVDIHTNSESFQRLVKRQNGTAHLVEVTKSPLATEWGYEWLLDGEDYSIQVQKLNRDPHTAHATFTRNFWAPGPPHINFIIEGEDDRSTLGDQSGEFDLRFEGESVVRSMFGGSELHAMTGEGMTNGSYTFTLNGGYEP